MKKIFSLLLVLLLMLGLLSCGSQSNDTPKIQEESASEEEKKADNVATEVKTQEDTDKAPTIDKNARDTQSEIERLKPLIKDLLPSFVIKKPALENSSMIAYANFKNTLDLPIIKYYLYTTLKDPDTTSSFYMNYTVLPGEISPTMDSQGPDSLLEEDILINKMEVTVQTQEGERIIFEYNIAEDKIWDRTDTPTEEVLLDLSDLLPTIEVIESESGEEDFTLMARLKNTTNKTLSYYEASFLIEESNKVGTLYYNAILQPGETSPEFEVWNHAETTPFNPEGNFSSITGWFEIKDDKQITVIYDVRLKTSEQYGLD